jgi:hypothetical protein
LKGFVAYDVFVTDHQHRIVPIMRMGQAYNSKLLKKEVTSAVIMPWSPILGCPVQPRACMGLKKKTETGVTAGDNLSASAFGIS